MYGVPPVTQVTGHSVLPGTDWCKYWLVYGVPPVTQVTGHSVLPGTDWCKYIYWVL